MITLLEGISIKYSNRYTYRDIYFSTLKAKSVDDKVILKSKCRPSISLKQKYINTAMPPLSCDSLYPLNRKVEYEGKEVTPLYDL